MFNAIAYTTTVVDYDSAMDKLKSYKRELAACIRNMNPSVSTVKVQKGEVGEVEQQPR